MWRGRLSRKTRRPPPAATAVVFYQELRLSGSVALAPSPALDHPLDLRGLAFLGPGGGEGGSGALRAPAIGRRVETYPHRHRHAFASDDRLAIAQGGQEIHQPVRGLGHRATDDFLVNGIGHAQRENGIAFRQETGSQIGRPLRHDAERNTVFATLFGDTRERPLSWLEAEPGIPRRIAVGLLADDRHRYRSVAPEREIEGQAAQHRDDDVEHLRRDPRYVENRDW